MVGSSSCMEMATCLRLLVRCFRPSVEQPASVNEAPTNTRVPVEADEAEASAQAVLAGVPEARSSNFQAERWSGGSPVAEVPPHELLQGIRHLHFLAAGSNKHTAVYQGRLAWADRPPLHPTLAA